MAKYIKTEEGYKEYNQIEGVASILKGGEFVEVKDGVVDTNYGKLISEGNYNTFICLNTEIGEMWESPSFSDDYFTSLHTPSAMEKLSVGEVYDIELISVNNAYASTTTALLDKIDVGIASYYGDYGLDFRIKFGSTTTRIRITFMIDETYCCIISSHDLTGCHIKVSRATGQKDGYVYLPKTALEYDDKPLVDSENLVKSGSIYNAIQGVRLLSGKNMKIENGIISAKYGELGKVITETTESVNKRQTVKVYATPDGKKVCDIGQFNRALPPVNSITIKIEDSGGYVYLEGTYQNSDEGNGYYNCDGYIVTYLLDNPIIFELETTKNLPSTIYVTLSVTYPIEVDGIIKLPKAALDYDETPTQDSDNLITSGDIYTAIQELQTQINEIPTTEELVTAVIDQLPKAEEDEF